MMSDFGETIGDTVVESLGRAVARSQEHRPLASDLLESDEAVLVVFDAPGAAREDIQVRFENHAVHVRIDRFREFHEDYEMRFPGRGLSLEGTVDLPADIQVDPDAATATLEDSGVLRVKLPKRQTDDATDSVAAPTEADEGTASQPDSETHTSPEHNE